MPNDQPTLSAEQMAEVRAAVARMYSPPSLSHGTADERDVATVLNAAPALLALADEAVRLRKIVYENSMNVRDRYQVADAYAGTAILKTTGRSLKTCRRGCTIQPGDPYVQLSRRINERLCLDCAIRAQVVRES